MGILGDAPAPVSGFAGARANAALDESLSFGVYDMGRGHVIYLADNVLFRVFWKDILNFRQRRVLQLGDVSTYGQSCPCSNLR